MMGCKWLMAGGEAVVKIYEGAPHGFIVLRGMCDEADQAAVDMASFIKEVVGEVSAGDEMLMLN